VLKNDLLLRAARGEAVERAPVWLMRQAGRVLTEYKATRSRAKNFVEFVKSPDLACEVTIQPVDILGVDAAIIFSDILVIPEAMGLPYEMIEAKGPWFPETVKSAGDLQKLHVADPYQLRYVTDAIRMTKKELDGRVPLIGFAGAPWTILSYMVEGSGSKTFSKAKQFLYADPATAHRLLDMITESTIAYLNAQVDAGADLVQVFDSWAGVLGEAQFRTFSLPYLTRIVDALAPRVPVTLFAKDAHYAIGALAGTGCSVIGLDWTMSPSHCREVAPNTTLQGNADPCLLYASEAAIVAGAQAMLSEFGKQRYICNLGHGLYPDLERTKVKLFVDTVKAYPW
jgi:uroporphyrinogen decarboxylase